MIIPKFDRPQLVIIDDIIKAIMAFEMAKKNPHGPNVANLNHSPLILELRHGGPSQKATSQKWPIDPSCEFPFLNKDRNPELQANLIGAGLLTRHRVLYPMTKAYIQKQWHRVYAYNVEGKVITEVRLLVSETQDPTYKERGYKSAHEWADAMRNDEELAYKEIFSSEELKNYGILK